MGAPYPTAGTTSRNQITTAQSAPSDQLPFDLRPSLRHHRGSHKRLQLSSTQALQPILNQRAERLLPRFACKDCSFPVRDYWHSWSKVFSKSVIVWRRNYFRIRIYRLCKILKQFWRKCWQVVTENVLSVSGKSPMLLDPVRARLPLRERGGGRRRCRNIVVGVGSGENHYIRLTRFWTILRWMNRGMSQLPPVLLRRFRHDPMVADQSAAPLLLFFLICMPRCVS